MAKQPFENVVQHLFQIAARAEFKTLNDQDLLKRYLENRDELAFGELVRRYKGMIWYVCWRVLRQHQDVEDAFQATVMTLVRRANTIVGRETIEGWLHRTAFKVASNAKVVRERRHTREERSAAMRQERYESHECRSELGEVLDRELTRIPEKYRSPLILCYLNGLTWNEAAQRLGISPESLKWRLEEGRERLKKRLTKYGEDVGPTTLLANLGPGIHPPEVPSGLVERTLDMVRIMTLSNGALETAGISPQVALLVKGALGMTLKMKVLLGSMLLSLVVVGAGAAKYAGILHILRGGQQQEGNQGPAKSKVDKRRTRKDLYGDPLPEHALARMGTVRLWHGKHDVSPLLAFSPDGEMLASQCPGMPECILWDAATGREIRRLTTKWAGDDSALAFSSDGRKLATVNDGSVRLWEMATGKLLHTYRTPAQNKLLRPRAMTFLPNGRILALGSVIDEGMYVWEITTGEVFQVPQQRRQGEFIRTVAASPDGKMLATVWGSEETIHLWEVATGKEICHWACKDYIWSVTFSPDGKMLAAGREDRKNSHGEICVWKVATGEPIYQLSCGETETGWGFPLTYSPDGRMLVGGKGLPGKAGHLWDTVTGNKIYTFNWTDAKVAAFSPDGKIVATADTPGVVHWWEVATGKEIGPRTGYRAGMDSLAYSPDGKTLVSASKEDHVVRWWEVATGKEVHQDICSQDRSYTFVAYSPDGKMLASHDQHSGLNVWDAVTHKKIHEFNIGNKAHNERCSPHFASFSPDSRLLAAAGYDAIVHVWEIATGEEIYRLATKMEHRVSGAFWMIAFSPDGKMLAAPSKAGTIGLWEVATGMLIGHLGEPKKPGPKGLETLPVQSLVFSPDNQMLIEASDRGRTVRLWDVASGKELWQRNDLKQLRDGGQYRSFTFSSNGRMWSTAGDTGKNVCLWEVATGKEIGHLTGHQAAVTTVAFSPDGRTLASGSEDITCLIWDITAWSRLASAPKQPLPQQALSQKQIEAAWKELALLDPAKAYRALHTLSAVPQQAIPWLQKQILPVTPLSNPQQLTQWIADLDSDRFAVRAKAQQEIEKLGGPAIPALRQAVTKQPSIEVRRRLQNLLAKVEVEPMGVRVHSPKRLREIRAVQILESIGTAEARQVLQAWAQGITEAGLTQDARAALGRLNKRLAIKP